MPTITPISTTARPRGTYPRASDTEDPIRAVAAAAIAPAPASRGAGRQPGDHRPAGDLRDRAADGPDHHGLASRVIDDSFDGGSVRLRISAVHTRSNGWAPKDITADVTFAGSPEGYMLRSYGRLAAAVVRDLCDELNTSDETPY